MKFQQQQQPWVPMYTSYSVQLFWFSPYSQEEEIIFPSLASFFSWGLFITACSFPLRFFSEAPVSRYTATESNYSIESHSCFCLEEETFSHGIHILVNFRFLSNGNYKMTFLFSCIYIIAIISYSINPLDRVMNPPLSFKHWGFAVQK